MVRVLASREGKMKMAVINGSSGKDSPLYGTNDDDTMHGLGGDDTVWAFAGNDTIYGDDGNDRLFGDQGADIMYGGAGDDWLFPDLSDLLIDGGTGIDGARIDRQNLTTDQIFDLMSPPSNFVGIEKIIYEAGAGNDTISGGSLADEINGFLGNNTLRGGDGNDTLLTGKGSDILFGDAGDDFFRSGGGKDILTGGAGADIFQFAAGDSRTGGGARDVITDFEKGIDHIDVSMLGITSFDQLTFKTVGSGLIVYGDIHGDGLDANDFGLQLTGIGQLSASDFIFA